MPFTIFQFDSLILLILLSNYDMFCVVYLTLYSFDEHTISDKSSKGDTHPRLEPFSPGQVFNKSKGKQWHVIASANDTLL